MIAKGDMLYVCAACGRPRVPMEQPAITRSFKERDALAKAEADLKSRMFATVLATIAMALAAGAVGIALLSTLAFGFGILATFFFLATFVLGGAGAFGLVTANKAKARAEGHVRDAFGQVALDVMRQKGTVTARELGEILGVPENVADAALARLPARDDVRVDTIVDERAAADGLVRYRIQQDMTMPADALSLEAQQQSEHAAFEAKLAASMREKGQG